MSKDQLGAFTRKGGINPQPSRLVERPPPPAPMKPATLSRKDHLMSDTFVIHRLRGKPVEYEVRIRHFVSGGKWVMGVSLHGVSDPDEMQRTRVAHDLRQAADWIETGEWEPS